MDDLTLAPTFNPVYYKSYSRRKPNGERETYQDNIARVTNWIAEIGKLSSKEKDSITHLMAELKVLPAGRVMWVGGTDWIRKPENYPGVFNCSSNVVTDWDTFGYLAELAMMGCGTGAVLEEKYISQLPPIQNKLNIIITNGIGGTLPIYRRESTDFHIIPDNTVSMRVGDSRDGWVDSYQALLEIASSPDFSGTVNVYISLSDVRPAGEPLKGFGGIANPVKLEEMYQRVANVLNKAHGRQLNSIECCLVIDEMAACIVAGNVRRSAGMKQSAVEDKVFAGAKLGLWQQDESGNWRIDPEKDALRMSNHTQVYPYKPTLKECIKAVRIQHQSGEGAIQWAGEAISRSNADLLVNRVLQREFIQAYEQGWGGQFLRQLNPGMTLEEIEHRMGRYALNPCAEIVGKDFFCNLSEVHLNRLDPGNIQDQKQAFYMAGIIVASLLQQGFTNKRSQRSRELDPIVGVSFTGLFDFMVNALGVDWLRWWELGRETWFVPTEKIAPQVFAVADKLGIEIKTHWVQSGNLKLIDLSAVFRQIEVSYLTKWKDAAFQGVWEYCDKHGLKRPNRCTTVQPAGTKSLLTNASPGWHPPKAARFIRRITLEKNDPVALACLDYGYNVIPSQSDKDENGNLLNDPFDPQCSEWLVEIPVAVDWADLPGVDEIDISKFSALAQFDFYMQVQRHYTTHNTSATVEVRESEIEALGTRIYQAIQNDEGYISAALLARFDDNQTFPRLPYEPITKAEYESQQAGVLSRRKGENYNALLQQYDSPDVVEKGPAGCDSDKCLIPARQ